MSLFAKPYTVKFSTGTSKSKLTRDSLLLVEQGKYLPSQWTKMQFAGKAKHVAASAEVSHASWTRQILGCGQKQKEAHVQTMSHNCISAVPLNSLQQ